MGEVDMAKSEHRKTDAATYKESREGQELYREVTDLLLLLFEPTQQKSDPRRRRRSSSPTKAKRTAGPRR